MIFSLFLAGVGGLVACANSDSGSTAETIPSQNVVEEPTWPDSSPFAYLDTTPVAKGFDFPVGPPDAKGYYNAQGFTENLHLGDDWNGTGGGNSDLGDPVYAVASGVVFYAADHGAGWGNIVRVVHRYEEGDSLVGVESLYAHLDSIAVVPGQVLSRGQQLGTIGNADGIYYAHLHLEMRKTLGLPVGGGYDADTTGYLNPTLFIQTHR